ncbi:substrate-binding domain-containing protein, partial [Kibdelosporangium lantanae]
GKSTIASLVPRLYDVDSGAVRLSDVDVRDLTFDSIRDTVGVVTQDGDWLRDKGQEKADAILKSHPEVQVIYAQNDPMAEGAYLAAKAAGKESSLKFIGIDGLPIPSGGIKAVEAGRLSATFIYPTAGKEAVDAAKKILIDCQQVPKTQTLQTQLVTKDNATEVYAKANGG